MGLRHTTPVVCIVMEHRGTLSGFKVRYAVASVARAAESERVIWFRAVSRAKTRRGSIVRHGRT